MGSPQQNIMTSMSSPQTPIQPPQNPLIAMTNLSASPISITSLGQAGPQYISNKDNIEYRNMLPPCSTPSAQINSTTSNSQCSTNDVQTKSSPARHNGPTLNTPVKTEINQEESMKNTYSGGRFYLNEKYYS